MKTMLQTGLGQLGLTLEAAQEQKLLDYLALIAKWNRVYNLTAVRDPEEMLSYHLLDSLSALAPLQRCIKQHASIVPRTGQLSGAPHRPAMRLVYHDALGLWWPLAGCCLCPVAVYFSSPTPAFC